MLIRPMRGHDLFPSFRCDDARLDRAATRSAGRPPRDTREGVGRDLLAHAYRLALELQSFDGCAGIVVQAKTSAIGFYERFGLSLLHGPTFMPEARAMFITIDRILGIWQLGEEHPRPRQHCSRIERTGAGPADTQEPGSRRARGRLSLEGEPRTAQR